MQALHVKENIYSQETPETLAVMRKSLDASLAARKDKYAKELALQRANDKLCKDFANLVDPFSKWIIEQKDKITKSTSALEDQLHFVDSRISSADSDSSKLPEIKVASDKIENAGISNNRHTTITLKDLEVQWKQYIAFLNVKKKMLEDEIAYQKLRGITAEQFMEIEEQFKQFDVNKSNTIDKKELKACLYSLGEEKNKSEVEQIMTKFGKGGALSFEGFREFMMGVLGDSDTKDEIVNGFKLINRGGETASLGHMEMVMSDSDVDYIKKTAPQASGEYDYKKWVEDVFSR